YVSSGARFSRVQKPDAFCQKDLGMALDVSGGSRHFHLDELLGQAPERGARPYIQADPGSLGITQVQAGLVHALRLGHGASQVAHVIEAGCYLEAGDVDLPVIAGSFQEPYSFATAGNAVLEARGGIEHNAVKVQRLALSPQVSKLLTHG